jgi:hypothetical protein
MPLPVPLTMATRPLKSNRFMLFFLLRQWTISVLKLERSEGPHLNQFKMDTAEILHFVQNDKFVQDDAC